MMGKSIDGVLHIYGDNMSMINNASKPESLQQKKRISYVFILFKNL